MAKQMAWRILVISSALAFVTPALAKQASWPQSYHDAGHTGFNNRETAISTGNVAQLQLLWSQGVACGALNVALDDGKIYTQGQGSDCNTPDLEAIDAVTGAHKWTVATGQDGVFLEGTIAVGKDLVFAGCGFKDSGGANYGAICAYKKSTGQPVWQWSNPCNCLPESGVLSPLVYSGNAVYFGYGNGGAGGAEYVVAANATTGNTIWTYGTGTSNTLGTSPIAVADGAVYFGCAGANNFHGLCAAAQSDGTLNWAADLGSGVGAVTVNKGAVYVNLCNGASSLVALDAATGVPSWNFGGQECNNLPAAVAGRDVYFTGGDNHVYDLRARDGKMKWSLPVTDARSSPSLANGVVYVDRDRYSIAVSAYDAATGAPLWHSGSTSTTIWPPPVIANGIVYGANGDCGSICAYTLPAGIVHR